MMHSLYSSGLQKSLFPENTSFISFPDTATYRLKRYHQITLFPVTRQLEVSAGGFCWLYSAKRPRGGFEKGYGTLGTNHG